MTLAERKRSVAMPFIALGVAMIIVDGFAAWLTWTARRDACPDRA